MIAIVAKEYSAKLRHLAKTHRVNVASTCEVVDGSEDIDISHIDTSLQRGDVRTKGLSCPKWPAALKRLQYAAKPLPLYEPGKNN